MPVAVIESLDHEARGVTHVDGKAIFVEGALPGETIEYASFRRKPTFELATTERVINPSAQRVPPRCPHFGLCGGCSMQHLDFPAQVAAKQRVLEDCFSHLAKLRPEQLYPPIYGEPWGYRHRARLGVRLVPKKGGILVGFHERKSSYIADIKSCAILPPRVSDLFLPLRDTIGRLSIADRLPQVEVSLGANYLGLVLRNLLPLTDGDAAVLREFAQTHAVTVFMQPKGPDSVHRLWPLAGEELCYRLPEFDCELRFAPTDFTQVNHRINAILVRRALALLEPVAGERIADLFCGLGNFTLPIARSGASVVGIEGSNGLVQRARMNAEANGLGERCEFHVANLFEVTPERLAEWGRFDKMLIDPPREGAIELVKSLPDAQNSLVRRIVYVSCNPATLARDASVLVQQKGYRLRGAGVANMFPHTSHVESIALFEA